MVPGIPMLQTDGGEHKKKKRKLIGVRKIKGRTGYTGYQPKD